MSSNFALMVAAAFGFLISVAGFSPQACSSVSSVSATLRAATPQCTLSGGSWPWEQRQSGEVLFGRFMRHRDLEPGCAPFGVVTAGLSGDALDALTMAIDGVYEGPDGAIAHVPIAVLSSEDLGLRMREVLAGLAERDSVLPETPVQPRIPVVLLSGFSTVAMSATVRAVRALELTGGSEEQRPVLAVAVPNSLDKSLETLLEGFAAVRVSQDRERARSDSNFLP